MECSQRLHIRVSSLVHFYFSHANSFYVVCKPIFTHPVQFIHGYEGCYAVYVCTCMHSELHTHCNVDVYKIKHLPFFSPKMSHHQLMLVYQ